MSHEVEITCLQCGLEGDVAINAETVEDIRKEERDDVLAWLHTEQARLEYYEGGMTGLRAALEKRWHVGTVAREMAEFDAKLKRIAKGERT